MILNLSKCNSNSVQVQGVAVELQLLVDYLCGQEVGAVGTQAGGFFAGGKALRG